MRPSRQEFFNQYRENVIIEVVQALAKSSIGAQIAFKGGTALKLFYDLPRYSEDMDYDCLPGVCASDLMDMLTRDMTKKRWEITDQAVKYHTVLLELRFQGPERNFRLKIEISTREKELKTTILLLRGVPVLTLEPSFMMTEKLFTSIDRQAGRDIFDAWFILNNAYPLDDSMITRRWKDQTSFYGALLNMLENTESRKVFQDTGKLLNDEQRNWIKTTFLTDFKRLVRNRLN